MPITRRWSGCGSSTATTAATSCLFSRSTPRVCCLRAEMHIPNAGGSHYRPEIDGLRALAVVAVVLYHSHLPFLVGGYAGVDVFFAISGYVVISSLHREQARRGRVDWIRFGIRRARRLLPLLWLTVMASLALAYWLFLPFGEFQRFCKSAIAALTMSANLFFWQFGGSYFSPGIEQSPLMHLWSLSVEEQFYLLLPIVFLATRWPRLGGLTRLAWWLTAVSLALMAWGSFAHPTASFYLPFTRAWEFGAGALAALLPCRRQPHLGLGYGLLAGVVLCFLVLDTSLPGKVFWAGIAALLTALLLWQSKGQLDLARAPAVLRSDALIWIGQRAYAWYLLHWPAMVFYRSYWLEDTSLLGPLAVAAASLGLAAVAHRWVEVPCRYRQWPLLQSRFRLISVALLATATIVTTLFVLAVRAPERQGDAKWQPLRAIENAVVKDGICMVMAPTKIAPKPCVTGASKPHNALVVLWGDSHANHLWRSLGTVAAEQGSALRTWSYAGCPPLSPRLTTRKIEPAPDPSYFSCVEFAAAARADVLAQAATQKTIAVLAARWEPYLGLTPISAIDVPGQKLAFTGIDLTREQMLFWQSLADTIEILGQSQTQVILIAPIPEQRVMVPACLARFSNAARCITSRQRVEVYRSSTLKMLQSFVKAYPYVQLVDPINTFCDADNCHVGTAQEPWYIDDDHLSMVGTNKLIPQLAVALREATRRLAIPAGQP